MDLLNSVSELLESGGDVLWLILFVSICLWSLICERLTYFKSVYPKLQNKWISQWQLQTSHCELKEVFHVKTVYCQKQKLAWKNI